MIRRSFILLTIILSLLPAAARAAEKNPIVIWDGSYRQVDIQKFQLEPLGSEPVLPKIESNSAHHSISQQEMKNPLRWFRLRIENSNSKSIELNLLAQDPATHTLILVIPPAPYTDESSRELISRRDQSPDADDRLIRIDVILEPGVNTFYLGISSYLDMQNLALIDPDTLLALDNRFMVIAGFMLGGILLMTMTALIFYAGLRLQVLLYYSIYALTLMPLLLIMSGLMGLFFPAAASDWWEHHVSLSIQLAILGLMEFSLSILDIKADKPKIYTLLRIQSGLALLMALFAFTLHSDRVIWGITQISSLVAIVSLFSIGLRLSWQDIRAAWFYIAGLGIFLASAAVTLFASLNFNIDPLEPILCIMTGAMLQFFLLPFAIRARWYSIANENDQKEYELKEMRALLHILTHDLSGPLFVVQSIAELHEGKTTLELKTRQSFEKIRLAALSAQTMLKVVKELEAIEMGNLELILKSVPILTTLQASIEILKPKFEAKKVQIKVVSRMDDDDLKRLHVLGERTVLEHTVFHNILSNAIKFSKPQDLIQVEVEMAHDHQIAIHVKDKGIGIPKNLISNIFSHSSKTSRKGTAGEKGTGLGLPLARRYVQKFGGNVVVQSQAQEEFPDDHWTQFTVTLKKVS